MRPGLPVRLRPATADDRAFLERMLYEAFHWRPGTPRTPRAEMLADPAVGIYVEGWGGRPGDTGVVAEDAQGSPVGAAWYRFFTASRPGYGFVADDVPEVSVAVAAEYRGAGIGTALLHELQRVAAAAGIERLSLSVELGNPALHLYLRLGYTSLAEAHGSLTMCLLCRAS